MGRKHSLDAFQDTINDFFNNADAWAFTEFRLYDIIERNRFEWGLPHDKGVKYIIDYLKKRKLLLTNSFRDKTNKEKEIYSWKSLNGEWDGKMPDGREAPSGNYYYSLNAETVDGKICIAQSFLKLFR